MNITDLAFARDVFKWLAFGLVLVWAIDAGWPAFTAWRARRRRRNPVMRTVLPPPSPAVERGQRAAWRREWRA